MSDRLSVRLPKGAMMRLEEICEAREDKKTEAVIWLINQEHARQVSPNITPDDTHLRADCHTPRAYTSSSPSEKNINTNNDSGNLVKPNGGKKKNKKKARPDPSPRPDGWKPDERWADEFCLKYDLDYGKAFEIFSARIDANGAEYIDWNAAWRNYVVSGWLNDAKISSAKEDLNGLVDSIPHAGTYLQ